jgi:hypothetical protein
VVIEQSTAAFTDSASTNYGPERLVASLTYVTPANPPARIIGSAGFTGPTDNLAYGAAADASVTVSLIMKVYQVSKSTGAASLLFQSSGFIRYALFNFPTYPGLWLPYGNTEVSRRFDIALATNTVDIRFDLFVQKTRTGNGANGLGYAPGLAFARFDEVRNA